MAGHFLMVCLKMFCTYTI